MYISVNQSFFKEDEATFSIMPWHLQTNGCILTEDVRANAANPILIDKHYETIKSNAELLKFNLPDYFTLDFLSTQIKGVLTRNKHFQGANARITITRDMAANLTEITISSQYASDGQYEQNKRGLLIDIFTEAYVTTHRPSQLDQHCQLTATMAKATALTRHLDDMLLTNEQGFVVSAIQSSVFATKGNKLLTPPLELGVRNDVMRDVVLDVAKNIGFQIDNEAFIMDEDLLTLDEIFTCDTANGLQWVTGYKNHRFIHKNSKLLNEAVNKQLFA